MQIVKRMNTGNKCQWAEEDRGRERFPTEKSWEVGTEGKLFLRLTDHWVDDNLEVWCGGKPKLVQDYSFLSNGIDRSIKLEVATGNTDGLRGKTSPVSRCSRLKFSGMCVCKPNGHFPRGRGREGDMDACLCVFKSTVWDTVVRCTIECLRRASNSLETVLLSTTNQRLLNTVCYYFLCRENLQPGKKCFFYPCFDEHSACTGPYPAACSILLPSHPFPFPAMYLLI